MSTNKSKSYRDINRESDMELLQIIENGSYTVGRFWINIPEFEDATFISCKTNLVVDENTGNISDKVEIRNESTVDAVHRLYSKENIPGVLNFASFNHPGGGFINGALAQEEALCQASTLYLQLKNRPEYAEHQAINTRGKYNSDMFTSETWFIRDSKNSLVQKPAKAFVITSAAPNFRVWDIENNSSEAIDTIDERVERIIKLFVLNKCRNIILGAFGCGVFQNDPYIIANSFKKYCTKYSGYFDKILFSIYDRKGSSNFDVFREVFGK